MTALKISRQLLRASTFACVLGLALPAMAQSTPPAGSGMAPAATPGATTMAPATSGKTTATSAGTMSSTMGAPKPALAGSRMKLPSSDEFKTTALATAHCPGGTVVWSTLSKSKSYHMATSKYYGKTKHGAYVCEKDATAAGFHSSKE